MAIRDQRIDIGYGIEKVWRVVFDYRDVPEAMLQTGYVRYDNNEIPVWRPYDPDEGGPNASWQRNVWRNIYTARMLHQPNQKHVFYDTAEHDVSGVKVALPKIEVVLSHALQEHLAGLRRD